MSIDQNIYKNLNKNFQNIKLILFDLDDTLISEAEWYLDKWKECDHYLEKKYGILGFFEKISQIIDQYGFGRETVKPGINLRIRIFYRRTGNRNVLLISTD